MAAVGGPLLRPDAIVTANDQMALGVLEALAGLQLKGIEGPVDAYVVVAGDRVVDEPRQLLDRKPRRRGGVSDEERALLQEFGLE